MTDKDKKLIDMADNLYYWDWHLVADMEREADTEEARKILHDIRVTYAVQEKNSSDFNLY